MPLAKFQSFTSTLEGGDDGSTGTDSWAMVSEASESCVTDFRLDGSELWSSDSTLLPVSVDENSLCGEIHDFLQTKCMKETCNKHTECFSIIPSVLCVHMKLSGIRAAPLKTSSNDSQKVAPPVSLGSAGGSQNLLAGTANGQTTQFLKVEHSGPNTETSVQRQRTIQEVKAVQDALLKHDQVNRKAALENIRSHLPVLVSRLSQADLQHTPCPRGKFLPPELVQRFFDYPILKCLRVHPTYIAEKHYSDHPTLKTNDLTLCELRALYEHLRDFCEIPWVCDFIKLPYIKSLLIHHVDQKSLCCPCSLYDEHAKFGWTKEAVFDVLSASSPRDSKGWAILLRDHYGRRLVKVTRSLRACEALDDLISWLKLPNPKLSSFRPVADRVNMTVWNENVSQLERQLIVEATNLWLRRAPSPFDRDLASVDRKLKDLYWAAMKPTVL